MSNQITALVMVLAGRCLKGIGPIGEPSESLLSRWVLTEKRFQMNSYYCASPYLFAASQLAQTSLRSVLGEVGLDDLLSQREKLNQRLQETLDQHTDPWGIKVSLVEIKGVDLPDNMQRAMARQAEAEREK